MDWKLKIKQVVLVVADWVWRHIILSAFLGILGFILGTLYRFRFHFLLIAICLVYLRFKY